MKPTWTLSSVGNCLRPGGLRRYPRPLGHNTVRLACQLFSGGELLEQTTAQADWGIKKDSHEIQMHEAIPGPGSSLGSHFVLYTGPQVFLSLHC